MRKSKHLLGIDIWWKKHGANGSPERDRELAEYAAHVLHANAVDISFPVFTHPTKFDSVWASRRFTPSPTELAGLISECRTYRLSVSLRPLLNIDTKSYNWRGQIRPKNLHAFFRAYAHALKPYLVLARTEHVPTFVYLSELWYQSTQKADVGDWRYLVRLMRRWYHGKLEYSSSGDQYVRQTVRVPGYGDYTDAYWSAKLHWTASEDELYMRWWMRLHNLSRSVLRRTVLQEVGIAAVYLGYWVPSTVVSSHAKSKFLVMQRRWFAMVCHIVQHFDIKGLYFWTLEYSIDPFSVKKNNRWYDPTQWVNRAGGREIASCFAHV